MLDASRSQRRSRSGAFETFDWPTLASAIEAIRSPGLRHRSRFFPPGDNREDHFGHLPHVSCRCSVTELRSGRCLDSQAGALRRDFVPRSDQSIGNPSIAGSSRNPVHDPLIDRQQGATGRPAHPVSCARTGFSVGAFHPCRGSAQHIHIGPIGRVE